mmetsp:Transcript_25567/g.30936  ORF Transcript_25567/g.30936 Transcript_25567/m.30936 type:complete len:129 (+) Transcript_25567:368-754(+)
MVIILTACNDELERRLDDVRTEISKIQSESESSEIFGKVAGLRRTATLVETKTKLETRFYEVERAYPLRESTRQGLLECPNGVLFVNEGVIAVKRFHGAMETRVQYDWVGTVSFQEFFEDLVEGDDEY